MTLYRWDKSTPANNASSDATINWAEAQAPSSVNDSARGMMTAVAKYRDDIAGSITTGGTSTAYTVTTNQVFTTLALMNNAMIAFLPHVSCGATVTLNVDGLGAKPLRPSPGVELAAGALIAGTPYAASYNNSSGVWYLQNVYNIPAAPGSITGSMIAAGTITYSNIQNVTNARLLGNFTGGAAAVSEYAITGGLEVIGTTLSGSLTPQAAFKNLSVKVLTTTTVAVAADFVAMYDGTGTRTAAISATCNLGSAGAVNTLDTGSIAIDSWYYIWAISNGSTDGTLASLSSTAPTMPSGYTFKARIGAVQTVHATATLYGTWQLGRKAQYVVGLASTTGALLVMASGINGSTYSSTSPTLVAVSTTRFVPTTASVIRLLPNLNWKSLAISSLQLAPSASYSGANNGPFGSNGLTYLFDVDQAFVGAGSVAAAGAIETLLESGNIYYAATGAGAAVSCLGWEDNL